MPQIRRTSRVSFSPALRLAGLPMTPVKVYGSRTVKPKRSNTPAKMDVTGTPVIFQVLYHRPATAAAGSSGRNKSRFHFPLPFRMTRSRLHHTRQKRHTAAIIVENTIAVGFSTRVIR